ncbi:GntR family transcriptional regulator [Opitutaceae bacterium TAV4]|uniref:GntR family transcriptional regulator n=1 Tax=Geminisphaera colitermitum TaxID=1148786 RepID=UPI0005BA1D6D|nr:GntR family transcriptional regulator [Geminisphaera colitermitum]RRJ95629.1 GntR family transcriptional regulator [Opitutaceae bacterium TAV4]RRK02194.1 GntR family transcriptional regulator [Opitutaceae bacterium TAV3]
MTSSITVPPLQSGVVNEVRRRLIEEIINGTFQDGTLPTATDIAQKYGVGSATINRAMKYLQKEGWVERRAGIGTFLGPRARLTETGLPPAPAAAATPRDTSAPSVFRKNSFNLAVTVLPLDFSLNDWHVQHLLQGIDQAAAHENVTIELIGPCGGDDDLFARRLERSRPDLLAFLKPRIQSAPLLREARRLKIPCLATGTHWRDLDIPLIEEDGVQGACDGTRALIRAGHRRIGFLCPLAPAHLWFDRRKGYETAMREAFGDLDQNLFFWTGFEEGRADLAQLDTWLKKQKPTALLIAAGFDVASLKTFVASGAVRIPQTLSVVTFDNRADFYATILGSPTPLDIIDLPLEKMGAEVVRLAAAFRTGTPLPPRTLVPCTLVPGNTISPPSTR